MDSAKHSATVIPRPQSMLLAAVLVSASVLSGCGGGGGGNAVAFPLPPAPDPGGWTAGVFPPAGSFEGLCANPRAGLNPDTQLPFPDASGTSIDENNWLRSWSNDLYLWYDEIVDRDPALYTTPGYFNLLKTAATTTSGQPKDNFHFSIPTDQWLSLSTTGTSPGYGAEWVILADVPPREVVVVITEPASPAAAANLQRGARILEIDGADLVNANDSASIATLNAGLSPTLAGETHTFTVMDPGTTTARTITMTSADVTADPVPVVDWIDTPTGRIGYLLFNSHIGTAEQALINAVNALDAANIDDLVLDVRYNGGGFLTVASQLAYMIAGPTATAARTFERTQFNAKHSTFNPVTGQLLEPLPFLDVALGFIDQNISGQPLPSLSLPRVFVLTGPDTCSASESVMNSLRGINIEVIQIGGTTCGKPYGFYPTDNCGTTYFTIQFQGVNEVGFGSYSDGFAPANSLNTVSAPLPGCAVADDYDHALGDQAEARLATALQYRDFATCPAATAVGSPGTLSKPGLAADPNGARLIRAPWESIRWLEAP